MDNVLARLMQGLADDGWSSLEGGEQRLSDDMARMKAADIDDARRIARVLDNPDGQWLLAWLVKRTLLTPPGDLERSAKSLEMYAIHKARREGQNHVVFMLLGALQQAAGEPPITGGQI